MSLNHITTALDAASLESKEQYVFYHKMVDFVMKETIAAVSNNHLCTEQESTFLKQFCDVLLYSIDAMRIKYMYDEEDAMKIDLTESGFPNYLEFRYLYNDLALKENYTNKLKGSEELKNAFLDRLLKEKKHVSRNQLYQAASVVYYTKVQQRYIFNRFVQGKIVPSEVKQDPGMIVSWSFYDVSLNRPFVCFMYFDVDDKNKDGLKEEIYEVLSNAADRKMDLDTMAYAIDKKLPKVYPYKVKRIDLGPLHNVFAKDVHEITHVVLQGLIEKTIPLESYALSLTVDEIESEDIFQEGSFFKKQTIQRWGGVQSKKYLLAPHRVIQLLYAEVPELIDKLDKAPIHLAEFPKTN